MKKIIIPIIAVLSLTTMSTFASSDDSVLNTQVTTKPYMSQMKENKKQGKMKVSGKVKVSGGSIGIGKGLIGEGLETAIKANDYDAFVKAFNEQLGKITTPTQEEFAKMVANYKMRGEDKQAPLQAAIKANDYDAFVTAFKTLKPSNITDIVIPTKEEFTKMAEMSKQHDAIETAIKANDYTAFVKAFESNKPTVPTKEEFTKMVTLHKEIQDNRGEIKYIKEEKKEGTLTKVEAKEKVSSIKNENSAAKKATRLAKKPLRKVGRLSK